jgi:tetratricopeptide (TPR) repeat protein
MDKKKEILLNKYFQLEEWGKARAILLSELRKSPKDHWLLTRLGSIFYEQRDYKRALKFTERALKISPDCPLVIWDYASTLDNLKKKKEAISLWKSLIKRGINKIAFGKCHEGIRWAKSLIIDCYFSIGQSYFDLGNKKEARKFLNKHLISRQKGLPSIYSLKEVHKELLLLNK